MIGKKPSAFSAWLYQLANPTQFRALSKKLRPWLILVAATGIGWGLVEGLFLSPADYQQGDTVRIMYIHVPAAWISMMIYMGLSSCAIGTLVFRHPLADSAAAAGAPIGAAFTLITLLTGSLWGKPMWGTWWVWDARLTSVLVLFLLYTGIMMLRRSFEEPSEGAKVTAILILVGLINIPIIKFSVDWWNTLHQGASVVRLDGPSIHPSMLRPLLISALGFTALSFWLWMEALENNLLQRRLEKRQRQRAWEDDKTALKGEQA